MHKKPIEELTELELMMALHDTQQIVNGYSEQLRVLNAEVNKRIQQEKIRIKELNEKTINDGSLSKL